MPEIRTTAHRSSHFHGRGFTVCRFTFQVITAATYANQLQKRRGECQAYGKGQSGIIDAIATYIFPPFFRGARNPKITPLNAGSLENDRL